MTIPDFYSAYLLCVLMKDIHLFFKNVKVLVKFPEASPGRRYSGLSLILLTKGVFEEKRLAKTTAGLG